jgi:hypothetical protein
MMEIEANPNTNRHMRYEEIEARYPRLVRSMQWAAILSLYEALDCIRALKEKRGSGEAVSHFGGPVAVLKAALRCPRYALKPQNA